MGIDKSIEEIKRDTNFGLILLGAVIWLLGMYPIPFIAPLSLTVGFALVCTSAAISSLQRSTENATIGLLIGGIIQIIGYYITWVPLFGWFIGPIPVVFGGVLIIFYAIPLAIQSGKVPFLEEIQERLDRSRSRSEESEESDDSLDSPP